MPSSLFQATYKTTVDCLTQIIQPEPLGCPSQCQSCHICLHQPGSSPFRSSLVRLPLRSVPSIHPTPFKSCPPEITSPRSLPFPPGSLSDVQLSSHGWHLGFLSVPTPTDYRLSQGRRLFPRAAAGSRHHRFIMKWEPNGRHPGGAESWEVAATVELWGRRGKEGFMGSSGDKGRLVGT